MSDAHQSETEQLPANNTLAAAVAATVPLSIIAHGISAAALANRYAKRVADRKGEV